MVQRDVPAAAQAAETEGPAPKKKAEAKTNEKTEA